MKDTLDKTMIPVLLGLLMNSTASSAAEFLAGPPNPNNGFSEYVTDAIGLKLELCLDPAFCLFDPVDPTNDFSRQIGFGSEGFWWLAEPDTSGFPGAIGAVLVLAAEAAFAAEVPIDGDQFPFTRLRIRLDLPVTGFYRVTEPYGEHIYNVTAVDAGNEVNESFDVQFNQGTIDGAGTVTEAVNTYGGPWLTWDTYPTDGSLDPSGDGVADFIGDGATPHAVTGSPTGNNLFKIEAFSNAEMTEPLNTFDPGDGDGDGSDNSVTASLFTVVGKVYDGRLATAMVAERVTYSRDASGNNGQVDVFTQGAATASVTAEGGPNLGGPFGLVADQGSFFLSQPLTPNAVALPSSVEIEAAGTTTDPTRLIKPLADLVSITRAEYDLGVSPPSLTIEAASSDASVPPMLTVVELNQPLTAGAAVVTQTPAGEPIAPPASVTVSSSAGGLATSLVAVVNSDEDGDGVPNDQDNCPLTANAGQEDGDNDDVGNVCDNCTLVANADQRDTDTDGFGNMCDADLTNDNAVNLSDFSSFRAAFGKTAPLNPEDEHADFNGDGAINLSDFSLFRASFGGAPGPSGLDNP